MKKSLSILILVLFSSIVFASTYFSPVADGSNSFELYGYLSADVLTKTLILEIKEITDNPNLIFKDGTVAVSTNTNSGEHSGQGAISEVISRDVFDWQLTGTNVDGAVEIKFTFTALSAVYGSGNNIMYYTPAHQFSMTLDNQSDLTLDGSRSNLSAFEEAYHTNNEYGAYSDDYHRVAVYSGIKTGDAQNHVWTEGGTCSIAITKYFPVGGVSMHYISNVAVEVKVE